MAFASPDALTALPGSCKASNNSLSVFYRVYELRSTENEVP